MKKKIREKINRMKSGTVFTWHRKVYIKLLPNSRSGSRCYDCKIKAVVDESFLPFRYHNIGTVIGHIGPDGKMVEVEG